MSSEVIFIRALILFIRAQPPGANYLPEVPHLIPSHWELGFQHVNSKGTQTLSVWCMATLRDSEYTTRGICEGELININEGSGFDKKDEDVPEEVMPTNNFTLQNLRDIL